MLAKKAGVQKGYMTTEELLTFIKTQLSGCNGNVFMDKILEDLRSHIAERPLFVPEKFKQWFVDRNVIYRNNPLAFLSKCGIADIDSGVFDKPQITSLNLEPMYGAMRLRNIVVGGETILIEIVEKYILNNELMTEEELTDWNHEAVEYVAKLKNPSTKLFVLLFEKSKKMKSLHLPLAKMKREAEKIISEWDAMIRELNVMSVHQEELSWDEIMAILKAENPKEYYENEIKKNQTNH